jgi:hypothetical protein
MITRKRKLIIFPRKVVVETNDNIISKTQYLCLCRVNQVKQKYLDHKSTTYYALNTIAR